MASLPATVDLRPMTESPSFPEPAAPADPEQERPARPEFLSTLPAGTADRRTAYGLMLLSALLFLALAPQARTMLAPVWAFVPIYETLLVVTYLLTGLLLFGQFSILRRRPLAVLASGYLFAGFMAIAHGLAFPGVFTPTGLLGANDQSSGWLYLLWHALFPLFVIAYCHLRHAPALPDAHGAARWAIACVTGVTALSVVLALLATLGHALLPDLRGPDGYTTFKHVASGLVWVASLVALACLFPHRSSSVLDLWLTSVVFTGLVDFMLSVNRACVLIFPSCTPEKQLKYE